MGFLMEPTVQSIQKEKEKKEFLASAYNMKCWKDYLSYPNNKEISTKSQHLLDTSKS